MKTYSYIIADSVIYEPKDHILKNRMSEGEYISLAIPASLCLQFMLEKQGEIVSQEELLSYAWYNRGMNVSPNTLYQNISILRKKIEELGGNHQIIKTIPKRGFIIEQHISIVKLESSTATEDIGVEDKEGDTYQNKKIKNDSSHSNLNGYIISPTPLPQKLTKLIFYSFILFIMSVMAGHFLYAYFIRETDKESAFFSTYVEGDDFNGCIIYHNKEIKSNEYLMGFIKKNNLTCGEEKWWYISNHPPSTAISIMQCHSPLQEKTKERRDKYRCHSIYSLGDA